MGRILASLFTLGWLELLDPQGYAMIVGLSTMVRKKRHVLLYIFVSYVTYALCGFVIYLGMDRVLMDWFLSVRDRYPQAIRWGRCAVGLGALVGFCILGYYLFCLATKRKKFAESKLTQIKSVRPAVIAGTSFVFTVGNMTGAWAIVAFISVVTLEHVSTALALLLMFVYTLFALLPKLLLYYVLFYCHGPVIEKVKAKLSVFCQIALLVIIWLFLGFLSVWGTRALL